MGSLGKKCFLVISQKMLTGEKKKTRFSGKTRESVQFLNLGEKQICQRFFATSLIWSALNIKRDIFFSFNFIIIGHAQRTILLFFPTKATALQQSPSATEKGRKINKNKAAISPSPSLSLYTWSGRLTTV